MRKLYLFIFVLFSSFYVNADSLHLIVVGDTNSDIEHQVLKDVQFIYSRGASLASELDFDYRPTILTGKLATKRSVLSFMDAKIIHPEDMVIFYFTGHGFRTRDKRTPWPNLHFQEADEWLGLEEIVERLFQVNPRFSLVIADCCNNYPTQEMPEKCSFHFPIASHHDFHPKVSELFKNSQGILVISGAEPGGFS